ncbi:hypothetical protein B0H19DRAFT_1325931 [Mycena capillaripes]|nr:hypothetical protein B0H19DRAFT_1325931 [Mycena capillaripes]
MDVYHTNFALPFPESGLETSRVKIPPHAYHTNNIENLLRAEPDSILLAVIDKTKGEEGAFAGVLGLIHTSLRNLSTEIACVICFPEFQRTLVNTNAVGILLRYCLDLPENGGLGVRRVQWTVNPANAASVRAAERMGMKVEGTLRWTWVLPEGKEGKAAGAGRGEVVGRDSVLLAICWDDWEHGGREHVERIMERQA